MGDGSGPDQFVLNPLEKILLFTVLERHVQRFVAVMAHPRQPAEIWYWQGSLTENIAARCRVVASNGASGVGGGTLARSRLWACLTIGAGRQGILQEGSWSPWPERMGGDRLAFGATPFRDGCRAQMQDRCNTDRIARY